MVWWRRTREWNHVTSARRKIQRCPGMSFLMRRLQATGMTTSWFQPFYGINGKPTFRRLANRSWVSAIFNHFRDIAAWNPKSLKTVTPKVAFWKKDWLREDFQNWLPRWFTTSQIHVLCVNFVKFGRPEIGKVVRYLLDKKKQNFASLSRSRRVKT